MANAFLWLDRHSLITYTILAQNSTRCNRRVRLGLNSKRTDIGLSLNGMFPGHNSKRTDIGFSLNEMFPGHNSKRADIGLSLNEMFLTLRGQLH